MPHPILRPAALTIVIALLAAVPADAKPRITVRHAIAIADRAFPRSPCIGRTTVTVDNTFGGLIAPGGACAIGLPVRVMRGPTRLRCDAIVHVARRLYQHGGPDHGVKPYLGCGHPRR